MYFDHNRDEYYIYLGGNVLPTFEMTDISLWVSILELFGPLISIMPLDFMSADPPTGRGSPAATPKFKRYDRYIVIGIDFGVIWAADFNNTIRF